MNFSPKISIIVPIYKAESFLPKCIESIIYQTFTNFELLLINDGSPDNSGCICDIYASRDIRIKVFHTENNGVSAARNLGLKNARGTWVAFIDSDDYVNNAYLQDLYAAVEHTKAFEVLIVQGIIYKYEKMPQENMKILDFGEYIIDKEKIISAFSEKQLHKYGYPYAKLYNLAIIKKNEIKFDIRISYAEDMVFMFHYITKIKKIIFIQGANYHYNIFSGGLSKKYFPFESENIVYQELQFFISQIEGNFTPKHQLSSLKKHAAWLLLRSLYCMYRRNTAKRQHERLQILRNLTELDIDLIDHHRYYKSNIILHISELLLAHKLFFLFDIYCRGMFFIRYKLLG